jgi:hypothetical protein
VFAIRPPKGERAGRAITGTIADEERRRIAAGLTLHASHIT